MRSFLLAAMLLAIPLAGCVGQVSETGENETGMPEFNASDPAPPIPTPLDATGLTHLAHVDEEQGFDAASRGNYTYIAARSGFYIVDISDPESPEKVSTLREAGSRYIQLIDQGQKLIAAASGANQEVYHFIDVTDPTTPRLLSSFDPGRTVHNMAVIPGTSMLYNPRGVGDPVEPGIDIIDASDPANPEVVKRWPFPPTAGGQPIETAGCGVLTFDIANDTAYCPAVSQTYILDISDRMTPEVVSVISNPAINVHHWTQQMNNGSTLLIADWAAAGNTPTCDTREPLPGSAGPPPGAVWAYDISDPTDPQPVSYFEIPPPPEVGPDEQCSPHVIERVPGTSKVVVAWHHAGVALIDAADPANLELVDRWVDDNNAWSVDVHGGLVIATDRDAGIDVVQIDG